jgi:acyl-CoA thioesterase-1
MTGDAMNVRCRRRRVACAIALGFAVAGFGLFGFLADAHAQIVAFGASNVAGKGVGSSDAFPAQLERLLAAKGYNVHVTNAGISGDTNAAMLARLDQAIPDGTRIVLLGSLGGSYNARRLGQGDQKAEYAAIVARLRGRGIKIIPVTAAGVTQSDMQADRTHLNGDGHARLAARLLPAVIRALGH